MSTDLAPAVGEELLTELDAEQHRIGSPPGRATTASADSPSCQPGVDRTPVVYLSIHGRFAIRDGKWKLCLCGGRGGWSTGDGNESPQLHDLAADLAESNYHAAARPEVVTRLTGRLKTFVADGRSTPGEKEKNDVDVTIHNPVKS